jgi:hypothetical protein
MKFYQHASYTPATSSGELETPASPTALDSLSIPPSSNPEDFDDPNPPLNGDSLWDQDHDVIRNNDQNCPSDVDSTTSRASAASEENDEIYDDTPLPNCSAGEGRHQPDEGMQELLEAVEKSLHLSTLPAQGINAISPCVAS